jgi:hypothetical protein
MSAADEQETHKLLDKVQMPRNHNGAELSVVQRVGMLASMYRHISAHLTAYRLPQA